MSFNDEVGRDTSEGFERVNVLGKDSAEDGMTGEEVDKVVCGCRLHFVFRLCPSRLDHCLP